MDSITMLRTAVTLFAIAAAGGLVMAGIRFSRQVNPPAWLAMLHGLLASLRSPRLDSSCFWWRPLVEPY